MGILPRKKKSLGKRKGEEGYGEGRATIAFGDDVLLDEEAMVETLLACLEAPDYRPPTLPSVAMELMELSRRPEVEIDDVVALVEKDTLIAGRILKLVQSPMYAGAAKIESLRDALMRLGIRTLRDLVMEISMNLKVFKSPDYTDTMEFLRRHATATAHLCKTVCRYTEIDGEYAFMAGLLHDVGIAGTLLALSDRKGPRTTPPDLIAIWPAVDRVHERAAELMAEHWQLPPELRMVIAAHHQVLIQGHAHPLAATVCLADDLAHQLGCGVIPKASDEVEAMTEIEKDCVRSHTGVDHSSPKTLEHAAEALRLGEPQLELLRADAAETVEALGEG